MKQKLKFIQDAFGLTAKMFSSIYKVEKHIYYRWLSGDEVDNEKIDRINNIYNIARQVFIFNIYRYGIKAKTFKPTSDRTLFDLLCDDELNSDKIISVCRELTMFIRKIRLAPITEPGYNNYYHHIIVSHNED